MGNGKWEIIPTIRRKAIDLLSISVVSLLLLLTETVNAADTPLQTTAVAHSPFPLPPRFSANAYASDSTVGQLNLMLPLRGNTTHNFYINPDLAYSTDNQGYADIGVGYRWMKKDTAILGGYVFGGYSRFTNNARVWVINPGIEALGARWDAHFNAYFPMGDRHYAVGDFLGATLGLDSPLFAGHSALDNLFHVSQYVGNGADVKLGYQLFPQSSLKGYVGSYFFAPAQSNPLWGGAAGLEYWLDSYLKVFSNYTYDSLRHSTVAVGLGVEFGGTRVHRYNPRVEERMTDPVERYLSELGRGSVVPSQKISDLHLLQVLNNNIAFFSQAGSPNNGGTGLNINNCTFENPCGPTDLTNVSASQLNTLLPNTIMYFNGGNYNALDVSGGTNPVTLQTGQSIYSRTTDYSQTASGAGRSTFNGAFILPANNTLDSIILLPTAATAAGSGVQINGGSSNLINNSEIGNSNTSFNTGIAISAGNTLLQDNAIYANGASPIGLSAQNSASVAMNNNFIQANGTDGPKGIVAAGTSTVTADNTTIEVNKTTGNGDYGRGIHTIGSGQIQMNNLNLTVTGKSSTGVENDGNVSSSIILDMGKISVSSNASLGNIAGLFVSNAGSIKAKHFLLEVTTVNGRAFGLQNDGTGNILFSQGSVVVGNTLISALKTGSSTSITHSTCSLNGSQITCS